MQAVQQQQHSSTLVQGLRVSGRLLTVWQRAPFPPCSFPAQPTRTPPASSRYHHMPLISQYCLQCCASHLLAPMTLAAGGVGGAPRGGGSRGRPCQRPAPDCLLLAHPLAAAAGDAGAEEADDLQVSQGQGASMMSLECALSGQQVKRDLKKLTTYRREAVRHAGWGKGVGSWGWLLVSPLRIGNSHSLPCLPHRHHVLPPPQPPLA